MLEQIYQGRSGNVLLQLIGMSILSEKLNLKVNNYHSIDLFRPLGFKVFQEGKNSFESSKFKKDDSLIDLLSLEHSINHGIIYDGTYQVKDFVLQYKDKITSHFNLSPHKNNNLFVHVRLGDVAFLNPGLEYYRKCIKQCDFEKGFISTDSPQNPMIKILSQEFSLEIVSSENIAELIDFARRSNFLVLSRGTLSWWMGFLSQAEKIFVPGSINYPNEGLDFTGDIFVFEDWIYERM